MYSARLDWKIPPNRFSLIIECKRRAGRHLIDLSESNPTRVGIENPGILTALLDPASLLYEPHPRGLLKARESIAGYYADRGEIVDPERIWITSSTSEAYSLLIKLLADPGCELLVPRPSYPLLDFLAALDGVQVVSYPLIVNAAGWHIDISALRANITDRTRAVVIVSPNNPTGSYLRRKDRDAVIEICCRHDLAIIVDEVFFDYVLDLSDGDAGSLLAANDALCFVVSGISKVLALPQMKLGWIAANVPRHRWTEFGNSLDLVADTYLSASAPVQHATPVWMNSRREIQEGIRERLLRNLSELKAMERRAPWKMLPIEGGWYAVLEFNPVRESEEETILALAEQDEVIVHPGFFFDFPHDGFLVVSLLPDPGEFVEGMNRIGRRLAG